MWFMVSTASYPVVGHGSVRVVGGRVGSECACSVGAETDPMTGLIVPDAWHALRFSSAPFCQLLGKSAKDCRIRSTNRHAQGERVLQYG